MKKKINKEKLEEVKKLLEGGDEVRIKEANLMFDGNQYSLKIPRKFIDELNINLEEDAFKIELRIPPYHIDKRAHLKIELIRKDEKEK